MVTILDTTLREGEQTPGVFFDPHIKFAVARLLDEIGIDIIEAGHPAVTDDIAESISRLTSCSLNAKIGAHARSLRKDIDLALRCGISFIGIFYCISDDRLRDRSESFPDALKQICDLISYARHQKPDLLIRYTPEDAVRSDFNQVVTAAVEAVRAGADIISIADTTGYLIPGTDRNMYDWISRLKEALDIQGVQPNIAVHCHNDRGLALPNALDGYRAGADIIDVSVMGLGERAGIVDMATLLAVLSQDFSEERSWDLKKIPELYRTISRYTGVPLPRHFPVTGKNAFTHCAGVHTHAALKNPLHYQSLDPSPFGLKPEISLDHMTGMAALQHSLEKIGEIDLPMELKQDILKKVKAVGQKGRTVNLEELKWIVKYQLNSLSPIEKNGENITGEKYFSRLNK